VQNIKLITLGLHLGVDSRGPRFHLPFQLADRNPACDRPAIVTPRPVGFTIALRICIEQAGDQDTGGGAAVGPLDKMRLTRCGSNRKPNTAAMIMNDLVST
jgi:hypothetical protein